ncbi:UDP-N-acetylmuramoyl-L-alanine--D-glutamate ligase [Nocardioides yefusunii]|uniref:UDP-N-acetylmuramoylalanine--D-glutamate ligase n=1 Tax=Nocardioides yefusunii TaxID=2500546 RepID=A0ABW1QWB7_9ACTN|nr:UDP-N-acetylmuramoyl-L-alanine--D-glutamate ligase [Nocardioides yefusunii]
MKFSDLSGQRVVVWGLGREGASVLEHCRALGVDVSGAEPDREAPTDGSANPEAAYGAAGRERLLGADVVIKSPGVPKVHELYTALVESGVAITSLTDLWISENAARVVAVTGTKGKSTTATLVHHVLTHAGFRSSLRGNIGTSVLTETDPPAEVVVMELSSYQAQSLTVSPRIVAVTSLFPEHLTWHGGLEEYYSDKLNAVAHDPEYVVVPGDDARVLTRVAAQISPNARLLVTGYDTDEDGTDPNWVGVDEEGALVWADGSWLDALDLPLVGRHHAGNIAIALRITALFGVTRETAVEALATFTPLPYRMERIDSADHRTWIDDSLATAPEAVIASLAGVAGRRVSVVVGGDDRGLDFTPLLDHVRDNNDVTLLLIGPSGARIEAEHPGLGRRFDSFDAAVTWARSDENTAEVVLLSPGAPSYDEFANYEARSKAFRAAALVVD